MQHNGPRLSFVIGEKVIWELVYCCGENKKIYNGQQWNSPHSNLGGGGGCVIALWTLFLQEVGLGSPDDTTRLVGGNLGFLHLSSLVPTAKTFKTSVGEIFIFKAALSDFELLKSLMFLFEKSYICGNIL